MISRKILNFPHCDLIRHRIAEFWLDQQSQIAVFNIVQCTVYIINLHNSCTFVIKYSDPYLNSTLGFWKLKFHKIFYTVCTIFDFANFKQEKNAILDNFIEVEGFTNVDFLGKWKFTFKSLYRNHLGIKLLIAAWLEQQLKIALINLFWVHFSHV